VLDPCLLREMLFGSWFDIQLVGFFCSQLLTMTFLFAEPSGHYRGVEAETCIKSTLTAACRAMIQARGNTVDPIGAIEQLIGWEKFVHCVSKAESLGRPEATDPRSELMTKYHTIRC
jgi:hypothetical protein